MIYKTKLRFVIVLYLFIEKNDMIYFHFKFILKKFDVL